jgi:ADP-L-glycero-D-manno-heptose 6-epimerase
MKTILVTGGGGFIGSNLVAALIKRATHYIVVCDSFGVGDKWRNLSKHPAHEIIAPEEIFDWLDANHANVEMIYHLGSISSTTEDRIDMVLKNNFALSVKLWRWCNKREVRLVYASAAATYGNGEKGFDDNIDLAYLRTLIPLSGYGWSKHLFDTHVATDVAHGQITIPQWVGLKIFNAYGPNEYHKDSQRSVIAQIAPHAIEHSSIKLFRSYNSRYSDGGQQRDMIYVKDIVRVMIWLLDKPEVSGLFNLGSGQASSFNAMAKAIFAALGYEARINYIDMPASLVKKYQYFTEAKVDRLRSAGFDEPFTTLQDGVRDFVQNYLLQDDQYL